MLLAASVVYWVLKFVQTTATPANAAVVSMNAAPAIDSAALARGLGGGIVPAATGAPAPVGGINASRFVLTGVVSGRFERQSIALIAVDGKPARPYRVGATVTDGVVLQSVQNRQAALASDKDAPVGATLELPKQTSAVAGTAIPVVVPQITAAAPVITPPIVVPPSVTASFGGVIPTIPQASTGQNPARPGASRLRPPRPNELDRSLDKSGGKSETEVPAGAATQ
jgi:general secretion pathway protein C